MENKKAKNIVNCSVGEDISLKKDTIRVAQVIGIAGVGGVEACIMNYYEYIDRNKVQFDFFVESTSKIIDKEKIEKMGGKVVIIPSYKHPIKYMKTLTKLFKEGKYDIVHSNMNALSVFTLCAAKKAGVKVRIAHSHSTSNKKEWKKNIIKNILRPFSKKYATDYFACSELAGRWLFGDKAFDSGSVTVINNAIDLERYKFNAEIRQKMRHELEIGERFCIGNVGRFMPQKNQVFLLDIFNEYQKFCPDSVLLLLGDGPLHDELVKKADELKIKDKIIFGGIHSHSEEYYQAMDVFVLPSLYEGLPVVGVEAQASGLTVLTSTTVTRDLNITGNVEYVSLKETAEHWVKIICERNLIYDRLLAYKKLKATKFDIKFEAERLTDLYEKLV